MADTPSNSPHEAGAEAMPAADDVVLARAVEIKRLLDLWQVRLIDAVRSGRAATSVARMGTARSLAELRHLPQPPKGEDERAGLVAGFQRQVLATVQNAAHEIERNRYTLEQMRRQAEKLEALYNRINPPVETEASAESTPPESDQLPPPEA